MGSAQSLLLVVEETQDSTACPHSAAGMVAWLLSVKADLLILKLSTKV